jgi:hypothetical protein
VSFSCVRSFEIATEVMTQRYHCTCSFFKYHKSNIKRRPTHSKPQPHEIKCTLLTLLYVVEGTVLGAKLFYGADNMEYSKLPPVEHVVSIASYSGGQIGLDERCVPIEMILIVSVGNELVHH